MTVCVLCGKKFRIPFGSPLCKNCLIYCPKCGKKKSAWGAFSERTRSIGREGLCDECFDVKLKSAEEQGYDLTSYVGAWSKFLKEDPDIGKHVSSIITSPKKGSGTSDFLGFLSGKIFGIGWMSVDRKPGLIELEDYPIEIIQIIDEAKASKIAEDSFTAKVFFFSPLGAQDKTPLGIQLATIKAKRKGIFNKEVVGIAVYSTFLNTENIQNDKELIENLMGLFNLKWMGDDLGDDLKIRISTRGTQEKKYLEIEMRTLRFSWSDSNPQVDAMFRTLISSVNKIVDHLKASIEASE